MKRLSVVLVLTVGLASGASPPQDFVSDHLAGPLMLVHGTGADHTLKILFLGDGFTSENDSIGAYRTAVDEMATELLATEPFSSMKGALSIYRMDVISDGAGIEVPETCPDGSIPPRDKFDLPPPPEGATPSIHSRRAKNPNNALDTAWCALDVLSGGKSKRMLGSNPDPLSVTDRLSDFKLASKVGPDITVVLVNDFMFGATAIQNGDLMYVSIGRNVLKDGNNPLGETNPDTGAVHPDLPAGSMAYVFVHEIGHLLPFRLLDEYSNDPPRALMELANEEGAINESPNLSTSKTESKWGVQLSGDVVDCANTTAPPPAIGAVPGGLGFSSLVYHSQCSCRMNESTTPEKFCPVCREQIRMQLEPKLPPK